LVQATAEGSRWWEAGASNEAIELTQWERACVLDTLLWQAPPPCAALKGKWLTQIDTLRLAGTTVTGQA